MICLTTKVFQQIPSSISLNDFNNDDVEFLEKYLKSKLKTGKNNMLTIRNCLIKCFNYLNTYNFQSITRQDLVRYYTYLDTCLSYRKKPLAFATKQTNKRLVQAFFNTYCEMFDVKNPNPKKTHKFTKNAPLTEKEETKKRNESSFSIDQLREILQYFYEESKGKIRRNQRFLKVIIAILTTTGMRISECLTIKRKNISFKKRCISTGLVENANKNHKRLYFPFPEELIPILKSWLIEAEEKDPNSEWLFTNYKGNCPTANAMASYFVYINNKNIFNFKVKSHSFRKTLTTFRINGIKKTPLEIEEFLSNHASSSIIMSHYNNPTKEERVKIYDEYFPEEYKPILELLSNW